MRVELRVLSLHQEHLTHWTTSLAPGVPSFVELLRCPQAAVPLCICTIVILCPCPCPPHCQCLSDHSCPGGETSISHVLTGHLCICGTVPSMGGTSQRERDYVQPMVCVQCQDGSFPYSRYKENSKGTKDLNVKANSVKLLGLEI